MLTRCLHKSQITPTRLMNGSYLRVRTICRFLIDSNIKDRNKSDVKKVQAMENVSYVSTSSQIS